MNPATAPPELLSIFPNGEMRICTVPARNCVPRPGQRERSLDDPATRRLYEALSVEEQFVPGIAGDHPTLPGMVEVDDGWGRAFVLGLLGRDFRFIKVARRLNPLEVIRVENACNEIRSQMD